MNTSLNQPSHASQQLSIRADDRIKRAGPVCSSSPARSLSSVPEALEDQVQSPGQLASYETIFRNADPIVHRVLP